MSSLSTIIHWGAKHPRKRGPVIATMHDAKKRNTIGVHAGTYAVQRGVAVSRKTLDSHYRPDFGDTYLTNVIRPNEKWFQKDTIVSIDPFGAIATDVFSEHIAAGFAVHPTMAITKAHIQVPEVADAMRAGRLKPDGQMLRENNECAITKVAMEPVWHLPGVAKRYGVDEGDLRKCIFEETGGMYPDLIKRKDLEVFLPPIGGHTVYIFGDPNKVGDPSVKLSARVHDECNGSDVFGSDICTCRPYLAYAIEDCIRTAQKGGVGIFVYSRNEGRAMGEVTKYLIYNARKRQKQGDRAEDYFHLATRVAGASDFRLYHLTPDILHWLGITRIDRFVSMSNFKHDIITGSGIEIVERVPIPKELIPTDAHVEINAKIASGYHTDGLVPEKEEMRKAAGRRLDE